MWGQGTSRACQTCGLCNLSGMWGLGLVERLGSCGTNRAPEGSLETGGPPRGVPGE